MLDLPTDIAEILTRMQFNPTAVFVGLGGMSGQTTTMATNEWVVVDTSVRQSADRTLRALLHQSNESVEPTLDYVPVTDLYLRRDATAVVADFRDTQLGRRPPRSMRIIKEGFAFGDPALTKQLQAAAAERYAQGPRLAAPRESSRMASALQRLVTEQNRGSGEASGAIAACRLVVGAAELGLMLPPESEGNRQWPASGRWLSDALRRHHPTLHRALLVGYESALTTGDAKLRSRVHSLIRPELEGHGRNRRGPQPSTRPRVAQQQYTTAASLLEEFRRMPSRPSSVGTDREDALFVAASLVVELARHGLDARTSKVLLRAQHLLVTRSDRRPLTVAALDVLGGYASDRDTRAVTWGRRGMPLPPRLPSLRRV